MAFIRDGTKLMTSANPLIIRDTADLTVKHRDGYKLNPLDMKDGWMIGQDNESLFWVHSNTGKIYASCLSLK